MENDRTYILGKMPIRLAIIKMALPVVFGMMIQVLYNLIDIWFIGTMGDVNQVTAVNTTLPIFIILIAFANIVGTGAASYISRSLGMRNYKEANKTLSIGIFICIAIGIVISIIGIKFLKQFITALGVSSEVYLFAYNYSFVMILCSIIVITNFAMGQLIRAEGAVMQSIIGMLIGTITNIILDPIFIFILHQGIRGAAIATILGNVASLIYYYNYYKTGKSLVKFSFSNINFENVIYKEIFKIGIPAAISQILMSLSLILFNNLAAKYGTNLSTGIGISTKIIYIGIFIFIGFGAGIQPLIGYNYGAKNFVRVKSIIREGIKITEIIGIFLCILFYFKAPKLVSLFTPVEDIVLWGTKVLRLQILIFLVFGPQMIANTSILAFGKGKEALFLAIARPCLLFIPLLLILSHFGGFRGLLLAQPIADGLITIIAVKILISILKIEERKPL